MLAVERMPETTVSEFSTRSSASRLCTMAPTLSSPTLLIRCTGLSHTLESQAGVSDGPAQIDHEFAALSEPALGQQVACNGISIAGSEPGQDIQNQRTGHKNMAFCEKTHHSFPSLIP